ncbi:MAG: THUMP domain-containing class I SAM-dependent RNA methyltransferase [Planctomycetota bacterium]
MPESDALPIFVACLPVLEGLVATECDALGAGVGRAPRIGAGGVACRADRDVVVRLNRWLGCASHVLLRVTRFRARHFAEFDKRARAVPFADWIQPGARVQVRASSARSKLYHTGGLAERLRTAVDAAVPGLRWLGSDEDDDAVVTVQVRVFEDECVVSLDSTGRPLHARGYRLATSKAPLREDLAHALVLASGWDRVEPFGDPMCGSGTIPLVAARLARGLPPSLPRRFAHESLLGFPAVVEDPPTVSDPPPRVLASDRDTGAIEAARSNAERAGVASHVDFTVAPLAAAPVFEGGAGAVVTNAPFGHRVGTDPARLVPIYQAFGARCRSLGSGTKVALLVADRRLGLRTGLPLQSAFLTSHGGLKVRGLIGTVDG